VDAKGLRVNLSYMDCTLCSRCGFRQQAKTLNSSKKGARDGPRPSRGRPRPLHLAASDDAGPA